MNDQMNAAAVRPPVDGYTCQDGIVSAIDPADPMRGQVTIRSVSACAACHAKGVCTGLDSQERIVAVRFQDPGTAVGDRVRVKMKDTLGLQALLWAMVLPLVLLMGAVFGFHFGLGLSDVQSALLGLFLLVPYYLALRLFRGRFSRKYIIHACKL